jgi:hypothetical protein
MTRTKHGNGQRAHGWHTWPNSGCAHASFQTCESWACSTRTHVVGPGPASNRPHKKRRPSSLPRKPSFGVHLSPTPGEQPGSQTRATPERPARARPSRAGPTNTTPNACQSNQTPSRGCNPHGVRGTASPPVISQQHSQSQRQPPGEGQRNHRNEEIDTMVWLYPPRDTLVCDGKNQQPACYQRRELLMGFPHEILARRWSSMCCLEATQNVLLSPTW